MAEDVNFASLLLSFLRFQESQNLEAKHLSPGGYR